MIVVVMAGMLSRFDRWKFEMREDIEGMMVITKEYHNIIQSQEQVIYPLPSQASPAYVHPQVNESAYVVAYTTLELEASSNR